MERGRTDDDRGAILVWMGLMMFALLGIGALALDLGHGYAVKRQLSSTADAVALAGAQEAGMTFKSVGGCGASLDAAVASAVTSAHAANAPAGSDGAPTPTITCTDAAGNPATGTAATTVSVAVQERSTLSTFLGRVLGVSSLRPAAAATAQVFGGREQGGLRPFTICMNSEVAAGPTLGKLFMSRYGQHNAAATDGCQPTGSPGDWGYASFDVGGSQSTLLCLIEFGYNGGSSCRGNGVDLGVNNWPAPGLEQPGNTGNSIQPSATAILDNLLDKTILLPAADYWSGNGMNATYDGYGALAVNFRGYIMPKPNGTIQVENYSTTCTSPAAPNTRTCRQMYLDSMATWSNVSLVIFWDYNNSWVTSYYGQNASSQCVLGSSTCIPTLRLVS